jgi:hypothetical protein
MALPLIRSWMWSNQRAMRASTENWVDSDQARLAVGPFTGNEGCAASAQAIENEIAASGAVQNSIGHQPDRFDRWVHDESPKRSELEVFAPA